MKVQINSRHTSPGGRIFYRPLAVIFRFFEICFANSKLAWRSSIGFLIFLLWAAGPLRAQDVQKQPVIDAAIVGIGLNFYQGDLDQNPNNNLIKFLGLANVNVLGKAERRFGRIGVGLMLTYDRFTGVSRTVDFGNNALAASATASYDLSFLRPDLLRVFIGGGAMLLVPEYYRFAEDLEQELEDEGMRLVGTIMGGLIIQDRVHLALRWTTSDHLDGVTGSGAGNDFLSFINLGYRFTLSR